MLTPAFDEMKVGSRGFLDYVYNKIERMGILHRIGLVKITTPGEFTPRFKDYDFVLDNVLEKPRLQHIWPSTKFKGIFSLFHTDYPKLTVNEYNVLCNQK